MYKNFPWLTQQNMNIETVCFQTIIFYAVLSWASKGHIGSQRPRKIAFIFIFADPQLTYGSIFRPFHVYKYYVQTVTSLHQPETRSMWAYLVNFWFFTWHVLSIFQLLCKKKNSKQVWWFSGRTVEREPKTCLIFLHITWGWKEEQFWYWHHCLHNVNTCKPEWVKKN